MTLKIRWELKMELAVLVSPKRKADVAVKSVSVTPEMTDHERTWKKCI